MPPSWRLTRLAHRSHRCASSKLVISDLLHCTMASISLRKYIRWLPGDAGEPTSTLVVTSPGRHFVDIRANRPDNAPQAWPAEEGKPSPSAPRFKYQADGPQRRSHLVGWTGPLLANLRTGRSPKRVPAPEADGSTGSTPKQVKRTALLMKATTTTNRTGQPSKRGACSIPPPAKTQIMKSSGRVLSQCLPTHQSSGARCCSSIRGRL